ncbi:MAG: anti-sigma factor [Bacteroidota bacterium]|nr:anti-sigma factor [Bacteroidota bacterium]
MNKEEIISSGLLELYAMGMTQGEETRLVEEALSKFPELRSELDSIESALEKYAMDHSVTPSREVKETLMAKIAGVYPDYKDSASPEEKSISRTAIYRIPAYVKIMVAASLLLMVGSLVVAYQYYQKYHTLNLTYEAAQAAMQKDLTANKAMSHDLSVMGDKNALPVVLKGTPHAPDALAKIYWMKNTGEVYVDPTHLPAAPPGKQYQLWAIVDGKPVDAGMIQTEKGIFHIQKMKSFGHAEAFAITMEKAGGSPTPSMDQMFVMAKI